MDEQHLDRYRVDGTKVRVIRDALEQNDVVGIVVAWDDAHVLIRKPNKRLVKLERSYRLIPADAPREWD